MKWLVSVLLLLVPIPAVVIAELKSELQQRPLVLTHVAVIDTAGASIQQDMMVVIVGDHIAGVGKAAEVNVPKSAQVIDARGKFLIPGLWDMHVHIFNHVTRRPPNTWYFPLFVANGITSIREMWTKPEEMEQVRKWREMQAQGGLLAPRIAAVGTLVDGPAGAETTNMAALQMGPTANVVSTPEEARQFVREVKAAGIDFVKTYSSLSREAYFAIADEATKQGIPFAGHVPFAIDAAEASSAGQGSMEHLDQILESSSSRSHELFQVLGRDWSSNYDKLTLDTFDEGKFKTLIATLGKNHSWQVPTLVRNRVWGFRGDPRFRDDARLRYIPADDIANWKQFFPLTQQDSDTAIGRRLWQKQLEVVRPMHQAGVPLLAGTDLGGDYIYPGFSLHDELALFVQAGLTPGEALKTATYNPAKFLSMLDRLGTVEKGKLADLVLLDANPLEDIHNTQKIRAVLLNGRYLDRSELDNLLAQAEANARETAARPLIIDMHLHAHTLSMYGTPLPSVCTNDQEIVFPGWDPQQPLRRGGENQAMSCPVRLKAPATDDELLRETLDVLKRYNIRAVTTGPLDQVTKWRTAAPDRIIPAIPFAEPKYQTRDPEAFRRLFAEGKFAVFAEVSPQYDGVSIADASLEPYFALAEELDIPVGIHMGEGPPGAAYLWSPKYRARLTSPFLLEEVLVRHPRLRVYVMHYGSPLVDEMLSMLFSHPQLYVDVAGNDWLLPRREFHNHLRRLVEAGFGKRIMFGSDEMVWPQTIRVAIESIETADFLTPEQKRDIFYNNAAHFLRLDGKGHPQNTLAKK